MSFDYKTLIKLYKDVICTFKKKFPPQQKGKIFCFNLDQKSLKNYSIGCNPRLTASLQTHLAVLPVVNFINRSLHSFHSRLQKNT